ncbi:tRNA glutamyl-Q(34) synthetase GluQRS [Paracoccus sp. Z118]|nr:tRNA glutamyl-Q(34) synthetase GluQRS [Paracoccus sp. Z118]
MAGAGIRRTRFAPSPTGPLHLGHAFAAMTAAKLADPGEFLLRIEDIDRSRSRPEWEQAIYDDLRWLGLDWREPIMRQSDRLPAYAAARDRLTALGVTYPCRCRRADIRAALSAPQEGAPLIGPDGPVYPGTCRHRAMTDAGPEDAIRLNAARAFDVLGITEIGFLDEAVPGRHVLSRDEFLAQVGDIVLSRRDMGTSYHLAVVMDDGAQQVTVVSRGKDLFESTYIHALLQNLLELPLPLYHHHRLIRDENGKRLAKRDDARALSLYREQGVSPQEIRQLLEV